MAHEKMELQRDARQRAEAIREANVPREVLIRQWFHCALSEREGQALVICAGCRTRGVSPTAASQTSTANLANTRGVRTAHKSVEYLAPCNQHKPTGV